MAQRNSGYARQEADFYATPAWVVEALAEHVRLRGLEVWEPAAGSGTMVAALVACGASVRATDLRPEPEARSRDRVGSVDFLTTQRPPASDVEAIITNPPYKHGTEFVARALGLMRAPGSRIRLAAFLFAADFDSAAGRTHLFGDCPEFAAKIVLLRRIRWFDGPSGPSTNHSWYVYTRPDTSRWFGATLFYAPRAAAAVGLEAL